MKIGAVVVTFNRLEKLKKALSYFDAQTEKPAYVIVVDNASTDGTGAFLAEWAGPAQKQTEAPAGTQNGTQAQMPGQVLEQKTGQASPGDFRRIVLTLPSNQGGSGGFYAGLKYAMDIPDVDWIWVSDDDAYPKEDAFELASKYLDQAGDLSGISAICGKIIKNGQHDLNHGKYYKLKGIKISECRVPESEYRKPEFEMHNLTYVAAIMNKAKLREVGLPYKEFFIYWDDLEHGIRMDKAGRIIGVPSVVAYHDTPPENDELSWKYYYALRNMTYTYTIHFKGLPFEYYALKVRIKLLYNRLTGRKNLKLNMLDAAFHDGLAGKLGLHEIYRPGWKPDRK